MAKAIIEDVIRLISKIAFPSSSHNNKSSEKIFGWSAQVDERRKSYIRLCKEMNSNSFSSMGMLFLENFNYSKDSYLASVFLSTYIQQVYLELSDALRGYRIISL